MATPAWAADPEMSIITEDRYSALPEDVQRSIEVVDGRVIFCRSGSRQHNQVARRLANELEAARPEHPRTAVLTNFEMHYVVSRPNSPGSAFRRPDVILHRCFAEDRKLMTSDALLVVEVVSPGPEYTVDKHAEYAREGIRIYLIVHLDAERHIEMIQEYRLDWASRTYRLTDTHQERLVLTDPFPVDIAFTALDA
ncbi:Uma2 family endonuclease [Nocardia sp. BMG111209]|uniref:Uma2 family endonuclease n=1 Tax=Nocardia sp. BMG111209 TaxID=1160137 RepID=UPI00038023BB|nr:Uma2 family endonuclease [Nocardia sp. BMG111209]